MTTTIDIAAQALVAARQTHRAAPAAPVSSAAEAYEVQAAVARALGWFDALAPGDAPRHWKSGGASREAVLSHSPLPPAGTWSSPADARAWPFHLRGIEAEVALRLARDVDARQADLLKPGEAIELVDAMCVSIEVVDSRWSEGLKAPSLAQLADTQSHGALVLGEWQPFRALDWPAQQCHVSIGAQPVREFKGTHSLGDPAFLLPAWLRHATQGGAVVRAGTVVTTGSWCGLLLAVAGDRVVVEFPAIGRAEVQL